MPNPKYEQLSDPTNMGKGLSRCKKIIIFNFFISLHKLVRHFLFKIVDWLRNSQS